MKNMVKNRKEKESHISDDSKKEKNERKEISKIKLIFVNIYKMVKKKIKSKHKYSFFMGIFIVFLICSGFFQILTELYHTHFYNFKYIDVSNTEKLKEVFFNNTPYLVYCKNSKHKSIHPVINSSRLNYPDILNVAIINCKSLLPSQQNIYQRFNLDESIPAFIISYGKKPKPISLNILNNKKKFLSFIRDSLVFSVPLFSKFPQFQTKCLNQNKKCILFISSKNLIRSNIKYNYINDIFINNKYFSINPMIIDSSRFQLKLNDEIFTSYSKNKDIHVLCLFNHHKDKIDEYYGYFYKDNFEDFKKLSNFVLSCMNATNESSQVIKLSNTPKIKYRTYKQK
ncbi:conserved Plasmodium protein, unknown function [Plasmodium gallinaceum]|uniref:Uncharacterized protein n=1 Tax=Plasmodium gallinaceum TaxID=5849 RepID=A0A1J1GU00_PLAGA|nr:conserved Plasmodium protein, unknown function [Plasmodium gallinaceum]CRG94790.1 conserved Plasmodium protein, unknown function [Plasmodium gallinaceum]